MKTFVQILLAAAVILAGSTTVFSQTNVRVTSLTAELNNPEALATFRILCSGQSWFDLNASQLSLNDNGRQVTDASFVSYASAQTRYPFTAMLVLDLSGSMMGSGMAGLKAASNALVDFMDPSNDETGIITFNSVVTQQQSFTSDTSALRASINGFVANGATAVWDAAYAGVQALAGHQGNHSQAVIVMTDGGDNSSSRSPNEVIGLALQHNKRIFTIALGATPQTRDLSHIADTTGGLFFAAPTPNDLAAIFVQIASFTRRGFDEYTIRFKSPDPGATEHTLDVLVTACDSTVTGRVTRKALIPLAVRDAAAPAKLGLRNYPNPVARMTTIEYDLPRGQHDVRLEVLDESGRVVATVVNARQHGGTHITGLDNRVLPNGVYFIRLRAGASTATMRMLVTK